MAQQTEGDHQHRFFEPSGSLTLSAFDEIRARLSRAGCHNPREQSQLLAQQLAYADATPLWALLMWNTPPALPLRDRLARWFLSGMPIGATGTRAAA